jgi:hypothetical protein
VPQLQHQPPSPRAAHARAPVRAQQAPVPIRTMSTSSHVIRRASACACGGGCPRCPDRHTNPKVGAPDDPLEREADAIADQVSAMPAPEPARTPAPATSAAASHPLDPALRAFFEPRFGRSFEQVRIHTGADAAAATETLRARAYTLGPDVWFNRGQYDPDSRRGRHLLAHELAHVAQSGAGERTLRRKLFDFQIDDLPADAASDGSQIFFERGSVSIPPAEKTKIKALAMPPKRALTLRGLASEDTPLFLQPAEIEARLTAVEDALKAAGHAGARVRAPHPGEGTGDMDYRQRRAVRVVPTPKGAKAAPNPKDPCGVPGSETAKDPALKKCETSFKEAFDQVKPGALEIVDQAEKDIVTTPTAGAKAVVDQFFAGVPRADIDANVKAIAAQVRQLPARHRCHTACDGGCDRPAYNSKRGLGPAGAMVTLCPDFVSAGRDFRVDTLLHEAAHGNPREPIDDIAYANTRLVPFLLPVDARRNTDSYVLLMRLVHKAGSKAFGPAAPDVLAGMTAAGAGSDTEQARRAVAWLESWLNYGDFDTGILYQSVAASLATPTKKWVTTGSHEFNIQTMNRLATAFPGEFTDPGPDRSARSTSPTEADKVRVAALHDRFSQMYSVVNQQILNVTRGPAGVAEQWGRQKALPRMTQDVTVAPSFFALSKAEQVKRLVALMMKARTDVSASFEPMYVKAIDLIRIHRRLGP